MKSEQEAAPKWLIPVFCFIAGCAAAYAMLVPSATAVYTEADMVKAIQKADTEAYQRAMKDIQDTSPR